MVLGPVTEGHWCHHTAEPELFAPYNVIAELMQAPKALPVEAGVEQQQDELHGVAARVFMKSLFSTLEGNLIVGIDFKVSSS